MLVRMFILRGVITANIATNQAHTLAGPLIANCNTLLANINGWLSEFYLPKVRAMFIL
jgi:hypothetical protein